MPTPATSRKRRRLTKVVVEVVVPTLKLFFQRRERKGNKQNALKTNISHQDKSPISSAFSSQVKHEDKDAVLDWSLDEGPVATNPHIASMLDYERLTMTNLDAPKSKDDLNEHAASLGPPLKKRIIINEDEKETLKKMFKSKVKKHEDMRLSEDVFVRRMRLVGGIEPFPVPLALEYTHQMVPRRFISNTYGGNLQETWPVPRKAKLDEYGYNDFMFLSLDYQPFAPQNSGNAGLWFSTEPGDDITQLQRVFSRDGRRAIWQYVGQYEVKSTEPLTREEWQSQSSRVRNTWGKEIVKQTWGDDIRARVQARKELRRGEELTDAKLAEVIASKRYKTHITPEDIVAAYDSGAERLGVWTMKCVDYDADFQKEICRKYPIWLAMSDEERKALAHPEKNKVKKESAIKKEPKVKREAKVKQELRLKKEKTTTKTEAKKEDQSSPAPLPRQKARGKKRKRAATPESEADDNLEDEEGETWSEPSHRQDRSRVIEILDSDEEEVAVYRIRGTRSRPLRA